MKQTRAEWKPVKQSWQYLFWASLSGITLFNTLVYIGAHYTTAINLALIGTTTSPIISIVLARIFLNEGIGSLKMGGMILCIAGVLFLLARGSLENLVSLNFTKGDGWILLAALSFAVYNTMVRNKPSAISAINFLFVTFSFGTLLLLPFYLWELNNTGPVIWNSQLILIILYLGAGASVICFWFWNIAIGKLGAGRTALFGNLIPVFSSAEAAILLNEQFTWIHIVSMLLVFAGIIMANWTVLSR